MAIEGLAIIGESINDSVPSTSRLFDAGDLDAIVELARFQDERGAAYIDLNVGTRPPELMADLVRRIQGVTAKPLAIDTPDEQIARAGLAAYDPAKAGGARPVLNSISALRAEMFELYGVQPFRPILLCSEQVVDGRRRACDTARQTYDAAKHLVAEFKRRCPGAGNDDCILDPGIAPIGSDAQGNLHRLIAAGNDDCILDPGIAPIGSDAQGNLHRLIAAIELIHADPSLRGVHASVGLSNFTVMLPSKRADGSPVKGPLESAFLTKAMPLGLDMVIGSVKRKYELLPPEHPAMVCLEDCLKLSGFEVIMRVREFYA